MDFHRPGKVLSIGENFFWKFCTRNLRKKQIFMNNIPNEVIRTDRTPLHFQWVCSVQFRMYMNWLTAESMICWDMLSTHCTPQYFNSWCKVTFTPWSSMPHSFRFGTVVRLELGCDQMRLQYIAICNRKTWLQDTQKITIHISVKKRMQYVFLWSTLCNMYWQSYFP